jgi:hypothetical protein
MIVLPRAVALSALAFAHDQGDEATELVEKAAWMRASPSWASASVAMVIRAAEQAKP